MSDNGGKPTLGAEIGVHRGETSQKLLDAFPSLMLFMVDAWRGGIETDDPYYASGDGVARLSQVEQDANCEAAIRATTFGGMGARRTVLKLPSQKAAERVAGRSFCFVFVDAAHHYEAVRDDIAAWWPLVRSGGILAGHDYIHKKNKDGRFGVKRAVDEFVATNGLQLNQLGSCWWAVKP